MKLYSLWIVVSFAVFVNDDDDDDVLHSVQAPEVYGLFISQTNNGVPSFFTDFIDALSTIWSDIILRLCLFAQHNFQCIED